MLYHSHETGRISNGGFEGHRGNTSNFGRIKSGTIGTHQVTEVRDLSKADKALLSLDRETALQQPIEHQTDIPHMVGEGAIGSNQHVVHVVERDVSGETLQHSTHNTTERRGGMLQAHRHANIHVLSPGRLESRFMRVELIDLQLMKTS